MSREHENAVARRLSGPQRHQLILIGQHVRQVRGLEVVRGADHDVEAGLLDRGSHDLDDRVVEVPSQRHALGDAHQPLEARCVDALRHDEPQRYGAVGRWREGRKLREIADRLRRQAIEGEAGVGGIDLSPELVGRGDRAIDPVTLLNFELHGIVARLEQARRQVDIERLGVFRSRRRNRPGAAPHGPRRPNRPATPSRARGSA